MRTLRQSKTWITLALLAMITVVASPVLALNCCCTSTGSQKATPSPRLEAQPGPLHCHPVEEQAALQPSCHAPDDARPYTKKDTDSSPAALSFKHLCECERQALPPATFTQTHPEHSPLFVVLALTEQPVLFPAPGSLAHSGETSDDLPPRSSFLTSLAGRAPPAI